MDPVAKLESAILAAIGLDFDGAPDLDRLAFYRATVKAASSDGATVDVQCETTRIGREGFVAGVPMRFAPGTVAKVKPDAVVLVGWEAGDSARLFAQPIYEAGAGFDRIEINADAIDLNDGTNGAVRKGDTLNASSQMAAWALLVETVINGLVPGTFLPANSFTGATPANPGNTGQFGQAWGASGSVKIGD